MNKICKALIHLPCGIIKVASIKLFHPKSFKGSLKSAISPFTEISLSYGGRLKIGQRFRMRDGAKIRVRKNAVCEIGKNVLVNSNNIIAVHSKVIVGDNVQFSPGVLIYDHDHDFRCDGGVNAMKYKTAPIIIGNNVWIGANSIILRGTVIGDNSVVAAGSVLKGEYPPNSVIYQKRDTSINLYNLGE